MKTEPGQAIRTTVRMKVPTRTGWPKRKTATARRRMQTKWAEE